MKLNKRRTESSSALLLDPEKGLTIVPVVTRTRRTKITPLEASRPVGQRLMFTKSRIIRMLVISICLMIMTFPSSCHSFVSHAPPVSPLSLFSRKSSVILLERNFFERLHEEVRGACSPTTATAERINNKRDDSTMSEPERVAESPEIVERQQSSIKATSHFSSPSSSSPSLHSSSPLQSLDRTSSKTTLTSNSNEMIAASVAVSRPPPWSSSSTMTMGRRGAFVAMASAAGALLTSQAAANAFETAIEEETVVSIVDPLERLSIGKGKWRPKKDSISNSKSSNFLATEDTTAASTTSTQAAADVQAPPAAFSTYAARFLLHYDDGAAQWWKDVEQTSSLLPESAYESKLDAAFASFAKTVEMAITDSLREKNHQDKRNGATPNSQQFYQQLWTVFAKRYGTNNDKDVMRQLAVLFSLLPTQDQPVACLEKVAVVTAVPSTASVSFSSLDLNGDYTELLPNNYRSVVDFNDNNKKAASTFRVDPPLPTVPADEINDIGTICTPFGPLAANPLTRDRPTYTLNVYALLGISGATGCALTHSVVIPLDVIKTRAQTNPRGAVAAASSTTKTADKQAVVDTIAAADSQQDEASSEKKKINFLQDAVDIVDKEGVEALLLGAQATVAGYFWYGLSVYPSYTFFKRFFTLSGVMPPEVALVKANDIALIAGALAAVVASLGLTPLEAARIRVVAEPETYRPMGLSGTLGAIASEKVNGKSSGGGFKALYAGFPSLLTRQVIFGSIKFLAFERASGFIYSQWPILNEATWTALGVSLVAGGISGTVSSVVSQPADSLLTYVAQNSSRNLGLIDGCRVMIQEDGIGSLFRGLGSRCVWAGSIIAGQFLLYDVFRTWFGVATDDLSQVYEITLSNIS